MFKIFITTLGVLIMLIKESRGDAKILEYFQQPGQHLHLQRKTTLDRIVEMGYPSEQHQVLTDDGYIISLFRIPFSRKTSTTTVNQQRPKVLLQHGLLGTSDIWILNGPDYSLPFLLADQGYDVWLGNSRGNLYGRGHKNLTIRDADFWRFSWHEIGFYDLPQMIDYILQHQDKGLGEEDEGKEKTKSLHYIGHSQGTTIMMVLLSLRPEYQHKLSTINLMAPAVRFAHTQDRLLKVLSPYLGYSNFITERFSRQEFMPFNELFNALAYKVCQQESSLRPFCSPMALMVEGSFEGKNRTALMLCMETHPGGISTEQILHFMQVYYASSFRQYDFGHNENRRRYNQTQPPRYPLENIWHLLHMWYGESDMTVSPIDVENLLDDLSAARLYRVPDAQWSHGDFLFSLKVRGYVYEPIMKILNEHESEREREMQSAKIEIEIINCLFEKFNILKKILKIK